MLHTCRYFLFQVSAVALPQKSQEGVQHSRTLVLHTNSHYKDCMIKYTANVHVSKSEHVEVTRYYLKLLECQEIKRMHKQWIPGPFFRFFKRAWE